MIQITITGETLDDVFAKMKGMMGGVVVSHDTRNDDRPKGGIDIKDDLDNAPVVSDEAPKRGRGRPAKPQTIEGTAKDVTASKDVTPPSAPEAAQAKTYTVEDIRARVQKITDNAKERGDDMPAAVAYVKKLFARFGMAKVSDLPAEKYGEFMMASEKFLEAGAK